uniref:Uncharacterized protein n=1 Tax=Myotis myotis TaxID=51298 RepID=A0A7J7Z437_MYOMY|nr:hypothetical protein mMyoMyo1_010443 [Myotis myotis]
MFCLVVTLKRVLLLYAFSVTILAFVIMTLGKQSRVVGWFVRLLRVFGELVPFTTPVCGNGGSDTTSLLIVKVTGHEDFKPPPPHSQEGIPNEGDTFCHSHSISEEKILTLLLLDGFFLGMV